MDYVSKNRHFINIAQSDKAMNAIDQVIGCVTDVCTQD